MAADVADVALVGVGHMGAAVADRLLDAGLRVAVHNRTPARADGAVARGATRLAGAADAFAAAPVCVSSLADDAAVEATLFDVLAAAAPGRTLVETSTISVGLSERLARAAAAAGVDYLRAPFTGNPVAVRGGTATLIVSGGRAAVERHRPLLETIVPTVRYAGDGEQARVLKLVVQVMIGGTAALLAEALVLGEAAGVERAGVLETIGASVAGSTFVAYKTESLLRDDYSATFTTAMMVKDVDLVLALAEGVGASLPLTRDLRALYDAACGDGRADQDFLSLFPYLRDRPIGVTA